MISFNQICLNQADSQPFAFVLATVISFLLTPLIISDSSKSSKRSQEAHHRKTNIPRLGGIAILITIIITVIIYLAIFGRYTPHGIKHWELEAIMAGGIIMFCIGLLDDIQGLKASSKLISQIMAASLVWAMGLQVNLLANPAHYLYPSQEAVFRLSDISSYLITVIFIIAITNAINLIDGIDGLAVGVCLFASIASWAINLSPVLNQPAGAAFAATLAGACFGFLRYNFNPARIFLGDSGAYFLGFALACVSCISLTKKATIATLSPILILVFAVPILDMLYAIYRRAGKKISILKPDLEHLHHQLLRKGFSEKQINYFLYTITFLGGLIGTIVLDQGIAIQYTVICFLILLLWIFFSLVLKNILKKP